MFFVISKILYFIVSPLFWVIVLLIFSFFAKIPKRKRISSLAVIILLIFFTNSFILNEFMKSWEYEAKSIDKLKTYEYGIVLGGISKYDSNNKLLSFGNNVDRLMQTIRLYKLKKIKKIFISGGSGNLLNQQFKEAYYLREYLIISGIPQEDILYETKSRNTHENAVYTVAYLKETKGQDCLLITSAVHMKRALACFKEMGLTPDYYVTDRYSSPRKFIFNFLFIPDAETFALWDVLFHEYIGYFVYYIVGFV